MNDRVNRGDLSGERIDRITFVCELAGNYQLPGLRFQWWDPVAEELHEETIAPVTLEVAHNPAFGRAEKAQKSVTDFEFNWKLAAYLLITLVLAWPLLLLVRKLTAWLSSELKPRKLELLNPRRSDKAEH